MTEVRPGHVSVIIVNYGTAELAAEAVRSVLARDHGDLTVDIHLVDNGSTGDDAEVLARLHAAEAWGARVTLYPETTNHGFGGGNNVVLNRLAAGTPPEFVFLLNPDARLENDVLPILAEALSRDPAAGIAGAGVHKPDGRPVTAAFRFPSPVSEFASALNFGPISRLFSAWDVPLPPDHPAGEVDWVVGAAAMIRWKVLERTGFFDPAYFLYYEEVDLMWQARQAGYRCLYVPKAQVQHVEGAATDVASGRVVRWRRPAYWYRSWRHYFLKNYGRTGFLGAVAGSLVGSTGHSLLGLLPRRENRLPKSYWRDFVRHSILPGGQNSRSR